MNPHPFFEASKIEHPRKECVRLALGLAWGALYQEKLDGRFAVRPVGGGGTLAGELMAGGVFIAWDCVRFDGVDVRKYGAAARWAMLDDLCGAFGVQMVESSPDGGKLLETVLARGGEGVVRKLHNATYYDAMTACKRLQTWHCRVTALDYGTGGARIVDAMTGEERGTVPLRSRAPACRVGSVVKVEGLELNASGRIREPRPCKDTAESWLVRW